jgi:hypothetical protein
MLSRRSHTRARYAEGVNNSVRKELKSGGRHRINLSQFGNRVGLYEDVRAFKGQIILSGGNLQPGENISSH